MFAAARVRRVDSRAAVVTEVDAAQAGSLALWQQGSVDLYTDDAVVQRAAARHDPAVLRALQRWWDAARQSMGAERPPELTREAYVAMMKRVYRAVIEEYDEEDACACAHDDWERDARGRDALTREMFHDALFELCVARRGLARAAARPPSRCGAHADAHGPPDPCVWCVWCVCARAVRAWRVRACACAARQGRHVDADVRRGRVRGVSERPPRASRHQRRRGGVPVA